MYRTLGEALDARWINSKSLAETLHVSVPYFYSTIRKAEKPGDSFLWRIVVETLRRELRIIPINDGWDIMTVREFIDDVIKREKETNERLSVYARKES